MGAAGSIRIPQEGAAGILPRLIDGLKALDIHPGSQPNGTGAERIRKALGEFQGRNILEKPDKPRVITRESDLESQQQIIPSGEGAEKTPVTYSKALP